MSRVRPPDREVGGAAVDEPVASAAPVRSPQARESRPVEAALRADVARVDGTVTVVSVAGEVDLGTAEAFTTAVLGTVSGSPGQCVVLELNRVTFLGARGLDTVLAAYRHALRGGGTLALVVDEVTPVASSLRFLPAGASPLVFRTLTAALSWSRRA